MTSVFLTSIGSSFQSIASSCKNTLTQGVCAAGAMTPNAFSSSLTAVQGVIGRWLGSRADETLEKNLAKLYDDLQALKTNKNVPIQKFVENNWALATLGISVLQGKKNQKVLYDKLFIILIPNLNNKETTVAICKNVIKNFQASGKETLERISTDLESEDFKKTFSIKGHPTISAITKLGEETHHKGRTPFLIELSNGTKVVYKPRSMAAEKHLVASRNSLFSRLNGLGGRQLGTYHILDKGEYGYCEFIDNRKEDNTFNCKRDLKEYARKIASLDAVAFTVSLTDLHGGNIATRKKGTPHAIDCEAVMGPHIQVEGEQFNTYAKTHGWVVESDTINKVFWEEDGSLHCVSSQPVFFEKYLDRAAKTVSILKKEEPVIEEFKEKLQDHKHRFVLIKTSTLLDMIVNTLKKNSFLEEIQKCLDAYHVSFDASQTEAILAQFCEDVMNNDVPVFFYHPASGTMYYEHILLGKKID